MRLFLIFFSISSSFFREFAKHPLEKFYLTLQQQTTQKTCLLESFRT